MPRLAQRLGIERTVAPGAVALYLDDGPHPEATPAVLELLARHGATATFFLVGEQVERRPELARAIHEAGHEIALHGYRHQLLPAGRVTHSRPISHARAVIADATGAARVSPAAVRRLQLGRADLVRALGWRPILWSAWGVTGSGARPAPQ